MIKKLLILLCTFSCLSAYTQNLSEINTSLGLNDSLTHHMEVRFYRDGSLFRMFKDDSFIWTAEYYKYNPIQNIDEKMSVKKMELKSDNDMEFIFQNLVLFHILDLPNMSKIKWKLKEQFIEKLQYTTNGHEYIEYPIATKRTIISDGVAYYVQVRAYGRSNTLYYLNPEGYLKTYPQVNELNYFCNMVNLIRKEFNIWKIVTMPNKSS